MKITDLGEWAVHWREIISEEPTQSVFSSWEIVGKQLKLDSKPKLWNE